jgi:thiamine kinase-like enzyme
MVDMSEFKKNIESYILEKKGALGIFDEINSVEVFKFQAKGKFADFVVVVNSRNKYFLRFDVGFDGRLQEEFSLLLDLPEEIGPFPYVFEKKGKCFDYDLQVLSFERGKSLKMFFEMHLIILARKLADIHKIKSPNMEMSGKKVSKLNLLDYFVSVNEKYFQNCPEMMEDKYIKEQLGLFQKYLFEMQDLFNNINEFSLIHGNLEPKNILFNEYDVKLVDWKNAHFCDNARDMATFFYEDSWFGERRVKLERDRIELFLDNYLKAYWSDSTFKKRVNVWVVFDMFCSLILVRFKFYKYNDEHEDRILNKNEIINLSNELSELLKRKL